MNGEIRIVARGSFPSSKEKLERETLKFNYTKRFIKRMRMLIKKGK